MNKNKILGVVLANHQSEIFTQDLVLTSIFKYSNFKRFGFSFDFPKVCYNHKQGDITWPKDEVDEIRNRLLSKDEYKEIIAELKRVDVEYKEYLKQFAKEIHLANNNPEIIKRFFRESMKIAKSISWHILELPLAVELEKLNIPLSAVKTKKTKTSLASKRLKELAKQYAGNLSLNNLKLRGEILQFQEDFGYLGMKYFQGMPWTIEQIFQMVIENDSCEGKALVEQPKEHQEQNNFYLNIAQELIFSRTQKWESLCYGCSLFYEMVTKYFSDRIKYEQLNNLRITEVIDILSGKLSYSEGLVKGRDNFILRIGENSVELILGESVGGERDYLHITEIKGQVARSGKVRGRVKIVLTPKGCSKVQKGDILVATMSTPDFLPAMGKAAAFVTDIGGITCHAAIVAREMGKPCIIGTEIATKVLKDGDLVEVDAEKGIVRKIRSPERIKS